MDQDLNDLVKVDQYRRCINLLQKRCEIIQKENERLVHRMYIVKQITKRRNKEISMLKNRLDLYNDSWRTAQPDPLPNFEKLDTFALQAENQNTANTKGLGTSGGKGNPGKKRGRKPDPDKMNGKEKNPLKKKRARVEKEKDPNAPKRPANPFFQFCQEQRSIIMDEMNSELQPGEPEPSKQELTRQLAQRWRTMDSTEKQIYINMYETSKQKYNQDMLTYKKDNLDKEKRIYPVTVGGAPTM